MSGVPGRERLLFSSGGQQSPWSRPWKFRWYAVWRILGALLVIFLALTLVFVAVEVLPVDPARIIQPRCPLGGCSVRTDIIAHWGLDKPLPDRYGIFVANVLTGNFGPSFFRPSGLPIQNQILDAVPTTLGLLGVSLGLIALVSIGLGTMLRRRKGSVGDSVVSFVFALPFAATALVLSLLAVYLFTMVVPVLPVPSRPGVPLEYFVIPVLVVTGSVAGLFMWSVRDHPTSPLGRKPPPGDWRPAVASEGPLREAVAGFLAGLPAFTGWTLTMCLFVDIVWNLHGLGSLFWLGVLNLDPFLTAGIVLTLALAVVLPVLLAADLVHEWITWDWVRSDSRMPEASVIEPRILVAEGRALLGSAPGFGGLVLLVVLLGMTVAAPLLAGPYPTPFTLATPYQPPVSGHFLGTNSRGEDILALVVYGGEPAIAVGLVAFAMALAVNLALIALLAGLGPRAGVFLTIPLDVLLILSFPVAGLFVTVESQTASLVLPAALATAITARILLRETDWRFGAHAWLPRSPQSTGHRVLGAVWGTGPLIVGNALLAVAFGLSIWTAFAFFGLGFYGPGAVQSWGQILDDAFNGLALLRGMWWWFVPPALGILAAVLSPLLMGLAVKNLPGDHIERRLPAAAPQAIPQDPTLSH